MTPDFLINKYTKWYFNIIESARLQELDGYTEKHHIIPKSLGGSNHKDNLVNLTARQHFVCHWLLTKMVTTIKHRYQMWNAFSCMLYLERPGQQRYKIPSHIFEIIKSEGSKIKSIKFAGEANPMYGKTHSTESKAKISATHKGAKRSDEAKENMRKASKGKLNLHLKGSKQTTEHIDKRKCFGIKNGRFGYKMTDDEIARRTATRKANLLAKKLAQGNSNA